MGPFPHDAPPARISAQNPIATDGFEFVEFAHPQPVELAKLFRRMGYGPVARHRTKNITVYRQGDINFILNAEPGSFATRFVSAHGPCASSMTSRVVHADAFAFRSTSRPTKNPRSKNFCASIRARASSMSRSAPKRFTTGPTG